MLRPDVRLDTLSEVTPDLLRGLGASFALLDLDDTLIASGGDATADGMHEVVAALKAAGLGVAILSNGSHERVHHMGRLLGVPGIAMAGKPFAWAFRRALRLLPGATPATTAMIGDQLFTDVLGAKRAGLVTVLVRPLTQGKLPHTRFARRLERMILEER